MSLDLHYFPGNASLAPHMVLEELGVPYRLQLVDRQVNAQQSPAYLKLNPNGKIPVLVEGDLVIYETAAVVLHLVDTHADAGLAPALGTPERAHFYKWLSWLATTLQGEMEIYFYPERWGEPHAAAVRSHAERRIESMIDRLEAELARHDGPWLMGARYSALDPYVLMLCRWTRGMTRPARTLTRLAPYLERLLERPAIRRAFEQEGIGMPWV